jgi:hypothetical protein
VQKALQGTATEVFTLLGELALANSTRAAEGSFSLEWSRPSVASACTALR